MSKKLAVFISGFGSNLNVFLQNQSRFEEIHVISSNPNAYGLERAKQAGVPSRVLEKKIPWKKLSAELAGLEIDLVFLAGFMKIIPASFVSDWQGRLYNLHPSLLPSYKGLNAIERAYTDKQDIGATIHHVSPEVDSGTIVLQEVAVQAIELEGLTLEQATQRVHECEHRLVQKWIGEMSV